MNEKKGKGKGREIGIAKEGKGWNKKKELY